MKNMTCIITLVMSLVLVSVRPRRRPRFSCWVASPTWPVSAVTITRCRRPIIVPQTDVKFWNYGPDPVDQYGENNPGVGDGWADLQSGFGYKPAQFGPEVTFGYTLANAFPDDDIYLVKYGISSQEPGGPLEP